MMVLLPLNTPIFYKTLISPPSISKNPKFPNLINSIKRRTKLFAKLGSSSCGAVYKQLQKKAFSQSFQWQQIQHTVVWCI